MNIAVRVLLTLVLLISVGLVGYDMAASGGMVFFIDGDKACTPMAVPDELLAMMDDVATAKISHEGSAL